MFSSSLPKTILRLLAVLVLLGITAWSFWQYRLVKAELEVFKKPLLQAELAQTERELLLAKVSQLMPLPADENPLILDIVNAALMSQTQPFFRDAIDGDKVIIFPESQQSIIYSPSRNIIVNVGETTVTTGQSEATDSAEPEVVEAEVTAE